MSHQVRITDETIREVAASASACERTVFRRLLGLPVRGLAAERVDRVLRERQLLLEQRYGHELPPEVLRE